MRICLYNLLHIGDIYFSSLIIRKLCEENPEYEFYYCVPYGHIFFKEIENCKHISEIVPFYNDKPVITKNLLGGYEDAIYNDGFYFLKDALMWNKGMNVMNFKNEDILFVNTYDHSEYFIKNKCDILNSNFRSMKYIVEDINNKYDMKLKYNIDDDNYVEKTIDRHIDIFNKYQYMVNNIDINELKDSIFIFNCITRSINTNLNELCNIFDKDEYKNEKLIFTDSFLVSDQIKSRKNVKYIDRDFCIQKKPSCENLYMIWEIAIHCKKIIIIPSGSTWTFLHKLNDIKENQLYFYNNHSGNFVSILNNVMNSYYEYKNINKKDLIKQYD